MFKEIITYKTKLSPSEIVRTMEAQVEPPVNGIDWRIFTAKKPFTGRLKSDSFEIWKTPQGRSSALVKAKGTILSGADETTVQVEIQIIQGILIFAGVWFVIAFVVCGGFVSMSMSGSIELDDSPFFILIPILFPLLGLSFFGLSYYMDKNRMKNRLKDMLKADLPAQKH